MWSDTLSANDLGKLEETLAEVIQRIGSLKELEEWLRAQSCVKSVKVRDYLIKTAPPQRELFVVFHMDDGSNITKVIDIILYQNECIDLAGVHAP